ncbi:hypothetical protein HU715_015785 [Pseudomonas sp. SWRI12]|uniref:Uncharacterized protein n=1 Tax=Pseudomonas zanjanensis TaxID=2745496 RepID=A0A923JN19_9PSED|nr:MULTISPECIES: hypothetical protein [Pseudomonas]MBC3383554.1 hypothetical protein [Pseudomonas sp. SWRI179]MBV4496814.1 hypothetical protein [Pseudomonas zanjanensis]
MAASRKTFAEYLQWAALKPRTNGWSALVAYDRNKCNQLLLQEYIEKYDHPSMMPPVDLVYRTGENTWNWLLGYIIDAPRLSFDNDPDGQSAEVNMSMAIVGGKKISLADTAGHAEVKTISVFDPLDFPRLEAEGVLLKNVQGSVDQNGEVLLDLGDPLSQAHAWELTGDREARERRMAGTLFKRLFQEADPVRRTFSLGKLAWTSQGFMTPQSFRLRTLMEKGADTRGVANYGNGLIEMRVAMDGEAPGGLPGEDWLYPLPSDRPDLDALIAFGSHFFMHSIIGKGTARAFNAPNAQFDSRIDHRGFIEWLGVKSGTEGYLEIPPFEAGIGDRKVTFSHYKCPIYINQDYRLTMTLYRGADGSLSLGVGMGSADTKRWMICTVNGVPFHCLMGLGFSGTYRFSLDRESRRLQVSLESAHAAVEFYPNVLLPWDVAAYMRTAEFNMGLASLVGLAVRQIFNGLEAIDAFILDTLLFNAENAVQLKTADLTGEMFLFGSIGARLGTFAIDPVEVLLSHGQAYRFKTIPETPGVKWSVEGLEGNTAGVGQINADTGAYIAPALAQINGAYQRIKIVATGPGNRHVSRALVTVVARAMTLNPLIEICIASKENEETETRQLSAHSLDGDLRWSVIGDGSIDPTANEYGENIYRAPLRKEPGAPTFTLDEVVVENTTTGQKQSSFMVVKHFSQVLSVTLEYQGLPANQAKLIAKRNGLPITAGLTWSCMPEEAGSIDSVTGVFTASEITNSQFVLIKARQYSADFDIDDDGFSLQPLPLVPFPIKPAPETFNENTGNGRTLYPRIPCINALASSPVGYSGDPVI